MSDLIYGCIVFYLPIFLTGYIELKSGRKWLFYCSLHFLPFSVITWIPCFISVDLGTCIFFEFTDLFFKQMVPGRIWLRLCCGKERPPGSCPDIARYTSHKSPVHQDSSLDFLILVLFDNSQENFTTVKTVCPDIARYTSHLSSFHQDTSFLDLGSHGEFHCVLSYWFFFTVCFHFDFSSLCVFILTFLHSVFSFWLFFTVLNII